MRTFDPTLARRLACLAAVAWAISLAFSSVHAPRGFPRPNVLLVSIDSLRPDHLRSYGYERATSPTIDGLAREGALFRTAVSSSSWTLPAHMTLMTGMPPEEHGVSQVRHRLEPRAITLAEVFRQAGYETAAFVSGPTVKGSYGFDQGFDLYDDQTLVKPGKASHRGATSPDLVRLVTSWLGLWAVEENRKPFFVFLHMWDVHYDYAPPPPYDRMFDPDYRGTITGDDFERGQALHREMDARDLEHVIALYDGEIRYTDEHLGRIIEWLRRHELLDDTVVLVTSDHGEEFFEHGSKGHAKALYEETIRVPLVVRYPRRVPAGQEVEHQVRLMDVAATILGLAGVEPPAEFGTRNSGADRDRDLTPWITGVADGPFPELIAFSSMKVFGPAKSSVRTPRHKLIRIERVRGPQDGLYDLVADPGEQRSLEREGEAHRVGDRLRAARAAWVRSVRGGPRLSGHADLDEDQLGRLRALGYIR